MGRVIAPELDKQWAAAAISAKVYWCDQRTTDKGAVEGSMTAGTAGASSVEEEKGCSVKQGAEARGPCITGICWNVGTYAGTVALEAPVVSTRFVVGVEASSAEAGRR